MQSGLLRRPGQVGPPDPDVVASLTHKDSLPQQSSFDIYGDLLRFDRFSLDLESSLFVHCSLTPVRRISAYCSGTRWSLCSRSGNDSKETMTLDL